MNRKYQMSLNTASTGWMKNFSGLECDRVWKLSFGRRLWMTTASKAGKILGI